MALDLRSQLFGVVFLIDGDAEQWQTGVGERLVDEPVAGNSVRPAMCLVVQFDCQAGFHRLAIAKQKINMLGMDSVLPALEFWSLRANSNQVCHPNHGLNGPVAINGLGQYAVERQFRLGQQAATLFVGESFLAEHEFAGQPCEKHGQHDEYERPVVNRDFPHAALPERWAPCLGLSVGARMGLNKSAVTQKHRMSSVPPAPSTTIPKELNIGPVRLDFPVVQAALSGYSDWAMRMVARQLGAPYALCEVMLDQFLVQVRQRQRTRHFLYQSSEDHPVGGQLMGAEPDQFAEGARRLVQAGFDVIDINFGCPVRKVLGRCRGGFHLGQPDVALEIIERTREVVPSSIPVTVKMRRGMDDSSESHDKFYRILEGAFRRGVAAATIHGRTVRQRYVGASNWEFLREVKRKFPRQVILGSGDLFTAQDCLNMMQSTGVDGVTVARGAIGNPWIFQQARQLAAGHKPVSPSLVEQREVMQRHYALALQLYGPDRCGPLMRKFGIKYAAIHGQAEDVRSAFISVRSQADWQAVLDRWYAAG